MNKELQDTRVLLRKMQKEISEISESVTTIYEALGLIVEWQDKMEEKMNVKSKK